MKKETNKRLLVTAVAGLVAAGLSMSATQAYAGDAPKADETHKEGKKDSCSGKCSGPNGCKGKKDDAKDSCKGKDHCKGKKKKNHKE